jgi:antitoxin (DNA-binding transcriptional repressor) of toxin-antitoxin stability system
MATATVRDLRNRFPEVRRLVERDGEVIVTDQGTPRYRLTRYAAAQQNAKAPLKDYMARMRRRQPRPLSARASKALHDANRGER